MSSKKSKNYELVLEGFENEAPQTLQKVKGILIGNLELSIPEVQKILESYPLTIKRSESESELSVHYSALKGAGAKVLLLKPLDDSASVSNEIEFALDSNLLQENPLQENPSPAASAPDKDVKAEDNVSHEIEFELNFDEISEPKTVKESKPAGTYELNLNEDPVESLKELEKELGESLHISEQNITEKAGNALTGNEFTLDLLPAAGGLELIESPALANAPLDSGCWETDALSESLVSKAFSNTAIEEPQNASATQMSKIEESLLELENPPEKAVKNTELQVEEQPKIQEKAEAIKPGIVAPTKVKEPEIIKTVAKSTPASEISPLAGKIIPETAQIAVPNTIVAAAAGTSVKKKGLPNDLLIPIIVGGILLGLVNWFYFSAKEEQKAANAPKIIIPEITEPAPVEEVKAPEAPGDNYAGSVNVDGTNANIKLTASADKISAFNLELSTAKPPELTAEEIVQQIPVRTWLRKAEIESALFIRGEDGLFRSKTPVKLYFENGESRERIIGEASITIGAENGNLLATIIVEHNSKLNENQSLVDASTDSAGKFAASFKLSISLNKIIIEKPLAAETEIQAPESAGDVKPPSA